MSYIEVLYGDAPRGNVMLCIARLGNVLLGAVRPGKDLCEQKLKGDKSFRPSRIAFNKR